jgi:hypothetical protein
MASLILRADRDCALATESTSEDDVDDDEAEDFPRGAWEAFVVVVVAWAPSIIF